MGSEGPQYVRAIYDFVPQDSTSSLAFERGAYIKILARLKSGWWNGLLGSERGWFPSNYVVPVTDAKTIAQLDLQFDNGPTTQVENSSSSNDDNNSTNCQNTCNFNGSFPLPNLLPSGNFCDSQAAEGPSNAHNNLGSIRGKAMLSPPKSQGKNLTISIDKSNRGDDAGGLGESRTKSPASPAQTMVMTATAVVPSHDKVGNPPVEAPIKAVMPPPLSASGHLQGLPSYIQVRKTVDNLTYYCNQITDETSWTLCPDSDMIFDFYDDRRRGSCAGQGDGNPAKRASHNSGESTALSSSSSPLLSWAPCSSDPMTLTRACILSLQRQTSEGYPRRSYHSHRRNSSRNIAGARKSASSSILNLEALGTFSELPTDNGGTRPTSTITWDRLTAAVSIGVHQLTSAVNKNDSQNYLPLTANIINAVRRLLLSSSGGGLERDAPVFRAHRLLRAHHRQITNLICALSLSSKIATMMWAPPNTARTIKDDAAALVRAVRQYVIEAENCGVILRLPGVDEVTLEFLPEITSFITGVSWRGQSNNYLATSESAGTTDGSKQRQQQQQQTLLTASSNTAGNAVNGSEGSWQEGMTVPSLFEVDHKARMRLRQQLAEHRSRQKYRSVMSGTTLAGSIDSGETQESLTNIPSVEMTIQLEDCAREAARAILLLQRHLEKRQQQQQQQQQQQRQSNGLDGGTAVATPSDSNMPPTPGGEDSLKMSQSNRMIMYSKMIVTELTHFLHTVEVLERFRPVCYIEDSHYNLGVSDKQHTLSEAAVAAAVSDKEATHINMLMALREARLELSHDVGVLVSATQRFAEVAIRLSMAEFADPAYGEDSQLYLAQALEGIKSCLHAVDVSALRLWLTAKRVLEARDIAELQSLWNCIAKYNVPINILAKLPVGSCTNSDDLSALECIQSWKRASAEFAGTAALFRRSMSLPYLKQPALDFSSLDHLSCGLAFGRQRAESSDNARLRLPYLGLSITEIPTHTQSDCDPTVSGIGSPAVPDAVLDRRDSLASAASSTHEQGPYSESATGSIRKAKFGDKLRRFFFDDSANLLSSSLRRNSKSASKGGVRNNKRASMYSTYTSTSGKSQQSYASASQQAEKSNRSSILAETLTSNETTENSSMASLGIVTSQLTASQMPTSPTVALPQSPPPPLPQQQQQQQSPPPPLSSQSKAKNFGEEQPSVSGRLVPSVSQATTITRTDSISNGSLATMSTSTVVVSSAEKKPWYLQYDNPAQDLLLAVDGSVKGGTLPALVERLTAHDLYNTKYVQTFLLTYHTFCTTPELFELLFNRFKIQSPPGLTTEELNEWNEMKRKPIQLRVYNLLKQWLDQHYMGKIPGDPQALEMLQEFCYTHLADCMVKAAEQLLQLIERKKSSDCSFRKLIPNLPASPQPILPRSMRKLKLLDMNPLELARQLTLIDSQLFNKIRPIECLKKAWSRPATDNSANGLNCAIAENIKAMGVMSTQLTLWVSSVILQETDVKKRANVLRYFISIADCCRQLNNFNSVMGILGSLLSTPISRLNRTRLALNTRSIQLLQDLRNLMSSDRNFSTYRTAVHSVNPPAIPFIGINRQDLTFIEDGNDDMMSTHRHLINFSKCIKTADTILEIQGFQNVPYALTSVPEIQEWLLKQLEEFLPYADNPEPLFDKFFQVSRILEPKEREDEKFIRLLQESGFL